jgi:hypothetical protein
MSWGMKGSSNLTKLLQGAAGDGYVKAAVRKYAAGSVEAAAMLGPEAQQAPPDMSGAGMPGMEPSPVADGSEGGLSRADQMRAIAETLPDMQQKQVLLQAADDMDRQNQPVDTQALQGDPNAPPEPVAPQPQVQDARLQPNFGPAAEKGASSDLDDFVDSNSNYVPADVKLSSSPETAYPEEVAKETAAANFLDYLNGSSN